MSIQDHQGCCVVTLLGGSLHFFCWNGTLLGRGRYGWHLWRRDAKNYQRMGAQDSEQLWDKKGQVLSLEVPCKGSPCASLLAKCPNQCWQPAPSLWDNKCHKDCMPDADLHGVSHACSVWQPLQSSPHQWEASYCSCLTQFFTSSFMPCVHSSCFNYGRRTNWACQLFFPPTSLSSSLLLQVFSPLLEAAIAC